MMPPESYVIRQDATRVPPAKAGVPLLSHLDVELTERCNNNCIHCCINLPADDLQARKRELSTEEIRNILKEAVSLGCLTVRFTGGEPLLREDFEELYIFTRKLGVRVILFTNATLITPRLAKLFERIPPLEEIEVTVYGMRRNTYEAVTRTSGSFAAAWRGINLLLENKVPFLARGTFLPPNRGEGDDFMKWAATIPSMAHRQPSYILLLDLRCRKDNHKNSAIRNLRLTPEEALGIYTRQPDLYIEDKKKFLSKFAGVSTSKIFTCGAGCHNGCVDAYGDFKLCLMLLHPGMVYDLKNGSLKEACENLFPKIRKMKSVNPQYLKKCARCFLRGFCEQCPARSWMEYGTLDRPIKYFCDVAHVQARYLGLLGKNELAWQVNGWKKRIRQWVA